MGKWGKTVVLKFLALFFEIVTLPALALDLPLLGDDSFLLQVVAGQRRLLWQLYCLLQYRLEGGRLMWLTPSHTLASSCSAHPADLPENVNVEELQEQNKNQLEKESASVPTPSRDAMGSGKISRS